MTFYFITRLLEAAVLGWYLGWMVGFAVYLIISAIVWLTVYAHEGYPK